jgi:ketosteroid isomerase-like protein
VRVRRALTTFKFFLAMHKALLLRTSTAALVITTLLGCRGPEDTSMASTDRNEGQQAATVLFAGRFMDKGGQHTSGTYHIKRRGQALQLVLDHNFKTDEGPDLHVVLSPTTASGVEGDNAMSDETATVIGPLVALEGTQVFDVPEEIDLTSFQSVLIHCIQYSHLYGAAPLQQVDERTPEAWEVRQHVQSFSDAFVEADAETLETLLTDDYIHTNTGGGVLDKTEWLAWIRTRQADLAAGTIRIDRYIHDEVRIRTYGHMAVVTGLNTTEGVREGEPFRSRLRFTHVWVKQGNQWRRAAFHDTRVTR